MPSFKSDLKRFIYNLRIFMITGNPVFFRFYYQCLWNPKNKLEAFIDGFSKTHKDIFFIQAGSIQDFTNDPLYKFIKRDRWTGIMIEPRKKDFEVLERVFKGSKVRVFNNAIDHEDCDRELYKVSNSNIPLASGFCSFVRENVIKKLCDQENLKINKESGQEIHRDENDWIETEKVECVRFETLFKKADVKKVDLLKINAGGFDFEIINMFDFNRFKPKLVIFEHCHLSNADYEDCKSLLQSKDYQVLSFHSDTIGFLKRSE